VFNVNRGVFLRCIFSNAVPSSENSLPAWGIRSGWIRRWLKVLTGVFTMGNDLRRLRSNRFGCNKRLVVLSEVPWLLRPIHFRPFIWDHVHLRPHSFETTFIWDYFIWDHVHLRPHSFETTFIWDHIHWDHFIWDHIHLRPHSFEATFILCHVKVKLFWFTVYHFLWSAFHFFTGDLKFSNVTIHLKFCKVTPSVSRGDSRWFVNAPALRDWSRGKRGCWPGSLTPRGHPVMINVCFK